jgi:ABC-2 type transport system permease protein
MSANLSAFIGGFQAELIQLNRSRLFLALTAVQAVTFLLLVSLFGLTGSRAPVAIVCLDTGTYSQPFIATLAATHHSFALKTMDPASSKRALRSGSIVAVITIPADFSNAVLLGKEVTVKVDIDNIDTDMTDDVQRALPSAIVAFGRQLSIPDIRLKVAETDLVDHDTDFIPYLVVSGLILDAFVIAGILSAMTVAREFESGTLHLLAIAPVNALLPILGRITATNAVACVTLCCPLAIVVCAYGIRPLHPLEAILALFLCTTIFSCIGVALGAVLKRTLPVTALILGLSLPLYICSGSLEPARFDGNRLWAVAHLSPVYYAVGVLENAFHGLRVTPEAIPLDCIALLCWAGGALFAATLLLRRQLR